MQHESYQSFSGRPHASEQYYDVDKPAMDPYTVQITNRLSENEKLLTEVLSRLYRLNDRLFGPSTLLANGAPVETVKNLNTPPIAKAMMEQIVGQTNMLNRRINDVLEALARLETL